MENILQEIRGCRKCLDAGYESVHPPPIFEGNIDAPVLIIGQAPGIEVFNQKQPFVGSSGKRLFSWLKQAGLKEAWIREHTFIFQRYLCYPGKQPDGSDDRSPSSTQLDLCQPHLSRVLSLMTGLNLRLIIPVGRLAIDAFFPASKALEEIIGQQLNVPCSRLYSEGVKDGGNTALRLRLRYRYVSAQRLGIFSIGF